MMQGPENFDELRRSVMRVMRERWLAGLEGAPCLHVLLGSRLLYSPEAIMVITGYLCETANAFLAMDADFFARIGRKGCASFGEALLDGKFAGMEAAAMGDSLFGRPVLSTTRGADGEACICAARTVNASWRLDENWELEGRDDDLSLSFPCDMLPAWGTGNEWNEYISECGKMPEAVAEARLKKAIFVLETGADMARSEARAHDALQEVFAGSGNDPTVRKVLAMTDRGSLALPHLSAFLFFNARLACMNLLSRIRKRSESRDRENFVADALLGMEKTGRMNAEGSRISKHGKVNGGPASGRAAQDLAGRASQEGEAAGDDHSLGCGKQDNGHRMVL